MREEVVEWRDGAAVVVKRQPLVVQVEQRSDDITGLPPNRGWIVDINSNLMHCSYFQKRSTWESLCYVKEDIKILGTCTVSISHVCLAVQGGTISKLDCVPQRKYCVVYLPVHLVGDGLAAGVVPDELPAAVEGDRVRVVADAVAVVVQELGLLRRPPHLHDPLRHHLQLVVPHAGVNLVRSREVLWQDHLQRF